MAEGPDDIDRWAQRLAGRSVDGDASAPEIEPLRRAIVADDARAAAEGAADRVGLERLLRRLEAEGLLRPSGAPGIARRNRWFAVAASVVLAMVTLRLLLLRTESDGTATPVTPAPTAPAPIAPPVGPRARGVGTVLLFKAADPEVYATGLVGELRALGLTPAVDERPDRIIIDVEVDDAQLAAFDGWLEQRDRRGVVPGKYRLIIDRGTEDGGR